MRVNTELLPREGRDNLPRTVEIVHESIELFGIDVVVTFTALGDGAIELHAKIDRPAVRIIAVTFPAETIARSAGERIQLGIPDVGIRRRLDSAAIQIVQAALPFNGFNAASASSTASVVQQALSMFGGGLSLCVQAVMMACDAGYLKTGERCIAFAADTAIVAQGAHTDAFLSKQSRLVVEHILCKPLEYSVSRPNSPENVPRQLEHREPPSQPALQGSDDPQAEAESADNPEPPDV